MRTRSVRHRGGTGTRVRSAAGSLSLLCALLCSVLLAQHAAGAKVWVLEIDGAIGPASADYFIRSLEDAEEADVDLVVLRLDTPGGLDKSMRDMIKVLLASRVPVATYVSPNGARAASAGTYIMYASHVAAMAPATNIGSSTPVSIGGGGSPLPFPQSPQPQDPPADETAGDGEEDRRGKRRGARRAARHADGAQGRQRRGGVHPRHRGAAGPERGVGGTDGARGLQPAGAGRPGPERHRPGGRGPRRTVRGARRRDHRRGGRRGHPRHVR